MGFTSLPRSVHGLRIALLLSRLPLRIREARDMARLFQDMGDVSRERTYLVTGAKAPEVRETP